MTVPGFHRFPPAVRWLTHWLKADRAAPGSTIEPQVPGTAPRALMIAAGLVMLAFAVQRSILATAGPAAIWKGERPGGQGFAPMMAGYSGNPVPLSNPSGQGDPWPHPELGGRGPLAGLNPVISSDGLATPSGFLYRPVRLTIPAIKLDAPILSSALLPVLIDGQKVLQWQAPDAMAVGWHPNSAPLGEAGNTVLNGHHNAYGEVFRQLDQLQPGDLITVFANGSDGAFRFQVERVLILEERTQPIEVRAANARWIQPTDDERLTLVTCWPYETNTHRLIVIAIPHIDRPGGGFIETE